MIGFSKFIFFQLSSSLASVTLSPSNNTLSPSTSAPRPSVFSTGQFNPDLPGPTVTLLQRQRSLASKPALRTSSNGTVRAPTASPPTVSPPTASRQPTTSTVYIGNLRESMNEQELFDLFSVAGEVDNIALPIDRMTGAKRGFGLCKFMDASSAQNAVDLLDGHEGLFVRQKNWVSSTPFRFVLLFPGLPLPFSAFDLDKMAMMIRNIFIIFFFVLYIYRFFGMKSIRIIKYYRNIWVRFAEHHRVLCKCSFNIQ